MGVLMLDIHELAESAIAGQAVSASAVKKLSDILELDKLNLEYFLGLYTKLRKPAGGTGIL
ncbi:MAG: hypothetical protein JXA66_06630, partial [Oligoflexia bacterium]|nr:hypothetical protein [Oligoflexia bacterium]